ncbi:DUF1573 domain-containing protein [Flavitalea flava]
MRYLFSCFLAAALLSGCKNKDKSGAIPSIGDKAVQRDSTQLTTIQWLDSVKDFGKISEGQKLEVSFRFKNTGDKPLVIERVQPSCGCTVAEQSKEPVAPGQEGLIKATFNSEGKTGVNHKTLNVFANTKETQNHSLVFTVEVEKK